MKKIEESLLQNLNIKQYLKTKLLPCLHKNKFLSLGTSFKTLIFSKSDKNILYELKIPMKHLKLTKRNQINLNF